MNVSNYCTEDKKNLTPYVTQSDIVLVKTEVSLGPITLTVMHGITPYVSFNVMFKFSLHFTSKCKTIDHF